MHSSQHEEYAIYLQLFQLQGTSFAKADSAPVSLLDCVIKKQWVQNEYYGKEILKKTT